MLTRYSFQCLSGLVKSFKCTFLCSPNLPCHFPPLTLGRKVQVKRGPQNIPDTVPETKRPTRVTSAKTVRKPRAHNAISQRPYKDRVIHLLALKNYKKPELLARLQRDGVNQKDKNSLATVLRQVRSWSLCQQFFPPAIHLIIILSCVTPVFKLENNKQLT